MTGSLMKSSSNTRSLPSDPHELSDGLNLIQQEIKAGNHSNIIIEEIFAIAVKPLEYICISTSHIFPVNKGAKTSL